MIKKLLTVITLFSFSAFAEKDIYETCVEKASKINNSIVDGCSQQASDGYKKDINSNYKIIYDALKKQSQEDADKFEQSNIGWLKYRNNHCELAGSYIGSPMYSYCPMQMNKARNHELEELAGQFAEQ